ncbi:L-threonine 3-dehydrogenase [bacterium]|nr:L-threonine 3-dehydrogenase [bacterium]MBU1428547.1 L-threonine 3-dehydrogenase [bacterium]MBU2440034.1 L-threonine 3-dehydrogenase [bacterium]
MKRILITGALGQIGSELITFLRKRYGNENVIASDIKLIPEEMVDQNRPFEHIDCLDAQEIYSVIKKYKIDAIFHLAAVLSATGEKNPQLAWKVNINGLYNVLEIAREYKCAVFTPSSIAAFGPSTPKDNTPQETIQRPNTIYGLTKVTGELLCDYYYSKYGVDTRGVRFPGIISYTALPGGGTTDYAVEIFYEALRNKKYTCFLDKDTYLDMMYMPDGLKAAVNLMEADPSRLKHRNAYNVTAESFNPEQLAREIKKYILDFEMNYDVDPMRQAIADSWPNRLDDSAAREDWGWSPDYNLEAMTKDMIEKLKIKLNIADK